MPDTPEAPFSASTVPSKDRLQIPACIARQSHDPSVAPSPSDKPVERLLYVPGEPTVGLALAEVYLFLARELQTPVLDELYPRLCLVGRRSGQNIDPLHRQRVKRRDIVPTEATKLHLTFHNDKIYLRPMPVCLLNHDFWTAYLPSFVDATRSRTNVSQARGKDMDPNLTAQLRWDSYDPTPIWYTIDWTSSLHENTTSFQTTSFQMTSTGSPGLRSSQVFAVSGMIKSRCVITMASCVFLD